MPPEARHGRADGTRSVGDDQFLEPHTELIAWVIQASFPNMLDRIRENRGWPIATPVGHQNQYVPHCPTTGRIGPATAVRFPIMVRASLVAAFTTLSSIRCQHARWPPTQPSQTSHLSLRLGTDTEIASTVTPRSRNRTHSNKSVLGSAVTQTSTAVRSVHHPGKYTRGTNRFQPSISGVETDSPPRVADGTDR